MEENQKKKPAAFVRIIRNCELHNFIIEWAKWNGKPNTIQIFFGLKSDDNLLEWSMARGNKRRMGE